MNTYHLRRQEKTIEDQDELIAIIQGQKYMTLAMCRDDEPYLVSLNYGFDPEARCFYIHCAGEGKKIDILRANPTVWGQVIEDLHYQDGKCDHFFRSVHFQGRVSFVDDIDEKRAALHLMIDALEPDPEPVEQRLVTAKSLESVTILKIAVEGWSGKKSLK
ncbi:MAG: pyridoxamine 5'-phosphate oxidase family protein [Anaerolineae bacterium]|nr:pyridoxamine 5'-phosphate oxidase family protein [Anaerolineae bacterium]